ncbi:DUF222 domain-containing protein [Brachybacterium sp. DNPG3]
MVAASLGDRPVHSSPSRVLHSLAPVLHPVPAVHLPFSTCGGPGGNSPTGRRREITRRGERGKPMSTSAVVPPLLLAASSPDASEALRRARSRSGRAPASSRRPVGLGQTEPADALAALWEDCSVASSRLAARYRHVVACSQDPRGEDTDADRAAVEVIHVSAALRCTREQAEKLIRDAHRVSATLPRSLERLEAGDLPVTWFERVLARTAALEDSAAGEVDGALGDVDLQMSPDAFYRLLGHLVTAAEARSEVPERLRPEARRRVVLDPPGTDGTACLRVIGPIPEILDLSHRLDAAAHAVQNAQRSALAAGDEVPCDPDGQVAGTGEVRSIAAQRYAVLLHAALATGPVEVPRSRYRLNVTVPFMTLAGLSEAPAMLEGTVPIPAEMARELAAGEDTWYRVLTDPCSGRFLPLPAQRYRPTPSMAEHLRLRHPTCAVPGCSRHVLSLSEIDHIEEWDPQDPESGGRTSVENLHDLCREHHRLKTAGLLDPERDDDAGRTWWEISDLVLVMQEDATDLATAQVVAEMNAAWESFRAVAAARAAGAERHREDRPAPDISPSTSSAPAAGPREDQVRSGSALGPAPVPASAVGSASDPSPP